MAAFAAITPQTKTTLSIMQTIRLRHPVTKLNSTPQQRPCCDVLGVHLSSIVVPYKDRLLPPSVAPGSNPHPTTLGAVLASPDVSTSNDATGFVDARGDLSCERTILPPRGKLLIG